MMVRERHAFQRDEIIQYVICDGIPVLKSLTTADKTTLSGRLFHRSAPLDVKLCLLKFSKFSFLSSFIEFSLLSLLTHVKNSAGYSSFGSVRQTHLTAFSLKCYKFF